MAPLRTTPAKGRNLTAELVARVERFEPDPGPEPGTTGAEAARVGIPACEARPLQAIGTVNGPGNRRKPADQCSALDFG